MPRRIFETVPGFFAQDDLDAEPIPGISPRFGLLDESPTRWKDFFARIAQLNDNQGGARKRNGGTSYKVLFLGRHGQGFHNVAETKYGTEAWDDYWSKLNGDGEITWGPDPELTSLGENQAVAAHEAWKSELAFGLPRPGQLYCSPLTRALKTCEITFDGILPGDRQPVVLENCREESGVHTCDKRRTRSYIEKRFPTMIVEKGLTEEDLFWDPNVRETKGQVIERAKLVLDVIFESDEPFVSITAHGGVIEAVLGAVGRPPYLLPTGGVLPIVVKSTYTPQDIHIRAWAKV